eukprot:9200538-Pyramimonas_sp.AAC.2
MLLDSVAIEVVQLAVALLVATALARLLNVVVKVAVDVALLEVVLVATVLLEVALRSAEAYCETTVHWGPRWWTMQLRCWSRVVLRDLVVFASDMPLLIV